MATVCAISHLGQELLKEVSYHDTHMPETVIRVRTTWWGPEWGEVSIFSLHQQAYLSMKATIPAGCFDGSHYTRLMIGWAILEGICSYLEDPRVDTSPSLFLDNNNFRRKIISKAATTIIAEDWGVVGYQSMQSGGLAVSWRRPWGKKKKDDKNCHSNVPSVTSRNLLPSKLFISELTSCSTAWD